MKQNLIALYSGAGIGLLIGVLMGLAVSPTVGIIIGALSSSLAILLGLNDKYFSNAKAIRIGSFGFACVLGALMGIFIRTNSLLAPDISTQFNKYVKVGFTKEQALDFIAYERFGILNKEWKIYSSGEDSTATGTSKDGAAPSAAELVHRGSFVGLYSAEVDESECVGLKDLTTDDSLPVIFQRFSLTGTFWKDIVTSVRDEIDVKYQKVVLLAIRDGICTNEPGKFTDEDCKKFANLSAKASTEALHSKFNETGGVWKSLSEEIKNKVPKSEQQKVLIILLKSACHDSN